MSGRPEVSVVIPARNSARFLGDQLEALAAQDFDGAWEVLVVDNGSTDGTAAVAASWETRLPLSVVSARERTGSFYARNRGASQARGKIVCFCDADDLVAPTWIAAYVRALRTAHAATGPLLDMEGRKDGQPWLEGRHASSGNLAVRRDVWDELGGFLEEVPEHAAEMEFSWRLLGAGFRLVYVPEAAIRYRPRSAFWSTFRQRLRWGRAEAFARRNWPAHMSRDPWYRVMRSYAWLCLHLVDLLDREGRVRWAKIAGLRIGRLVGSVGHRTWFP